MNRILSSNAFDLEGLKILSDEESSKCCFGLFCFYEEAEVLPKLESFDFTIPSLWFRIRKWKMLELVQCSKNTLGQKYYIENLNANLILQFKKFWIQNSAFRIPSRRFGIRKLETAAPKFLLPTFKRSQRPFSKRREVLLNCHPAFLFRWWENNKGSSLHLF